MVKEIKKKRIISELHHFLKELYMINYVGLNVISYYYNSDGYSIIDIHSTGNIRVSKSLRERFNGIDDNHILQEVGNYLESHINTDKYNIMWMVRR